MAHAASGKKGTHLFPEARGSARRVFRGTRKGSRDTRLSNHSNFAVACNLFARSGVKTRKGDDMRKLPYRIAYSACACLALFVALQARGAPSAQDPVEAVWR